MMVLGIFIYVGAEQCLSSGIPLFLDEKFGIDIQKSGLAGTGLFFLALLIGRFLGAVILNWISAQAFLLISVFLSIAGIFGLFVGGQTIAILSFFIIGLGFANIFPLIFSITVDRMPLRANELSGLMITAIVGGAVMPPIMGVIADTSSMVYGFIVPFVGLAYIGFIGIKMYKSAS
jgi:fucose permease